MDHVEKQSTDKKSWYPGRGIILLRQMNVQQGAWQENSEQAISSKSGSAL